MSAKVLVIGSGGREHAICKKLSSSNKVSQIFVCPGNAGTSIENKSQNIDLNIANIDEICSWSDTNKIDLVIVGPENVLADGIADKLQAKNIPCFGPSAKAAVIEASKKFSKDFMIRHNIPTARYQSFIDSQAAIDFINSATYPAWVVKASGLAAGKGVIVANSNEEACQAVKTILQENSFGAAGETIVVEEKLEGEEISYSTCLPHPQCLAFTDGRRLVCLPTAQDHKRLNEGDLGPNTGGMGAVCATKLISADQVDFVKRNILQKTVDGMREEGREFRGVLYAGIMLTKDGAKVLEFNCRLGDPECQLVVEKLEIIKSKNPRPEAAGERERKWVTIVNSINSEGETKITVDQAKKHWQYKQSKAKTENAAQKRSIGATGGGPPMKEMKTSNDLIIDAMGDTRTFNGEAICVDTPLFSSKAAPTTPLTTERPADRTPRRSAPSEAGTSDKNLIQNLQVDVLRKQLEAAEATIKTMKKAESLIETLTNINWPNVFGHQRNTLFRDLLYSDQ